MKSMITDTRSRERSFDYEIYEKMWIERKKELLDKIGKAPNPTAASRDVEELTSMIRQEVFASTKELQMKPGRVVGLCAVHITPGNVE